MSDPFEGSTDQAYKKEDTPASIFSAITTAKQPAKVLSPDVVEVHDNDEEFVIGLFDPRSFGAAIREAQFSNSEMATAVIEIIRTGNDKDRMAAMKLLRDMGKEALEVHGILGTKVAKQVQSTPSGGTQELTVSQSSLAKRLGKTHDPDALPIGIEVTKPLTKDQINDANVTYPANRTETGQASGDPGSPANRNQAKSFQGQGSQGPSQEGSEGSEGPGTRGSGDDRQVQSPQEKD